MTDTNQEVPKYTIFISTTYKKEYKKISNQEAKKNATKEIIENLNVLWCRRGSAEEFSSFINR